VIHRVKFPLFSCEEPVTRSRCRPVMVLSGGRFLLPPLLFGPLSRLTLLIRGHGMIGLVFVIEFVFTSPVPRVPRFEISWDYTFPVFSEQTRYEEGLRDFFVFVFFCVVLVGFWGALPTAELRRAS